MFVESITAIILGISASVAANFLSRFYGDSVMDSLATTKIAGTRLKGNWKIFYKTESGVDVTETAVIHGSFGRTSWGRLATVDEDTQEKDSYKLKIRYQDNGLYSVLFRPGTAAWQDFGVALLRTDYDGRTAFGYSASTSSHDGKVEGREIRMYKEEAE